MCGLIGYSGKENFDVDKIKIIMLWNETRGKDASGFYTPQSGIVKLNDKVSSCMRKRDDFKNFSPSNLLIGHTRAATVGSNTKNNAHPFEYGSIVGAHNGTLADWMELRRKNSLDHEYDMDSKVLIGLLNKYKDPRVFCDFEGSAACIFTDTSKKDNRIIFVFRNTERTLYRGNLNTESGKKMYISSMDEPLEIIGCKDIELFPTNVCYTIKDGEIIHEEKIIRKNKDYGSEYYRNSSSSMYPLLRKGVYLTAINDVKHIYSSPVNIKKGVSYLLTKDSDTYEAYIKGDDEEEVRISRYYFDKNPVSLKEGTIVKPVKDVFYKKTGEIAAKMGECLIIEGNPGLSDESVDVISTKTKESFSIPKSVIRPVSDEEYDNSMEEQSDDFIDADIFNTLCGDMEIIIEDLRSILKLNKTAIPLELHMKLEEITDQMSETLNSAYEDSLDEKQENVNE